MKPRNNASFVKVLGGSGKCSPYWQTESLRRVRLLGLLMSASLGFAVACGPTASSTSDSVRPASSEARLAEEPLEAVTAVLQAQQAAWNRGDLEAFMVGYWQSDELRFASGGEVRRGWQTTLDRYKASYPDRQTMGQLSFEELEPTVLSDEWALVHGVWRLRREDDEPNGRFTLTFRRFQDVGWKVVHDHTSSADQ